MKALIVINSFSRERACLHKAERIRQELKKRGVEADIRRASSIFVSCTGDEITSDISDYSLCFYLDKDAYLARALSYEMPIFNSYESLLLSDDKMNSILALKDSGIKTPETIFAPLCYVDDPDEKIVAEFLDSLESHLSYPMVYKACHGSLGKQVKLVHDRTELEMTYEVNKKIPHLYEEYIEREPAHDYRLIVIGGEVISAIKRVNTHDFRTNIALGGEGLDVTEEIPDSFKKVACEAAEILRLDYAGIDLLSKDGEPLFIEANGNAFFEETERVTRINVAERLVTHALDILQIR